MLTHGRNQNIDLYKEDDLGYVIRSFGPYNSIGNIFTIVFFLSAPLFMGLSPLRYTQTSVRIYIKPTFLDNVPIEFLISSEKNIL